MRSFVSVVLSCSLMLAAAATAQTLDPLAPKPAENQNGNALTNPGLSPEVEFLYQLEVKFAADTAKGGGAAFSSWFAPDAVTLGNGKAPVVGHDAIAASATWSPDAYQLTWTPEGARMGPAGDMGFTWGHYQGMSKDAQGSTAKTTGRYMTVWKKQPDGSWKVALDASNEGPAEDCCRVK
jgi:ketosteroid isomerase-like protein